MKKIAHFILVVTLLSSCSNDTGEVKEEIDNSITIEGVKLPGALSQGDTELFLNGGGVRKKLFVKVYVGGLYLPEKSHNPEDIIADDVPSIIRMEAISIFFTSKRMADEVRRKFVESTKGNMAPLQSRVDILCEILAASSIKKGDRCDIWYTPGEGIRLFKNGEDLKVLLSGLDFKQALFSNLLSDTPADESLKQGLLGLH